MDLFISWHCVIIKSKMGGRIAKVASKGCQICVKGAPKMRPRGVQGALKVHDRTSKELQSGTQESSVLHFPKHFGLD